MERFEQMKDMNKENIKEPKDKTKLLQWGGWSSSCFFYGCLRAFGAQAVRMYCCCSYVLLMICRINRNPQLQTRYPHNILKISPSYSQDIPKISPRYPKDIPKICPRYAQDIPKLSPRYPKDILKIS